MTRVNASRALNARDAVRRRLKEEAPVEPEHLRDAQIRAETACVWPERAAFLFAVACGAASQNVGVFLALCIIPALLAVCLRDHVAQRNAVAREHAELAAYARVAVWETVLAQWKSAADPRLWQAEYGEGWEEARKAIK